MFSERLELNAKTINAITSASMAIDEAEDVLREKYGKRMPVISDDEINTNMESLITGIFGVDDAITRMDKKEAMKSKIEEEKTKEESDKKEEPKKKRKIFSRKKKK